MQAEFDHRFNIACLGNLNQEQNALLQQLLHVDPDATGTEARHGVNSTLITQVRTLEFEGKHVQMQFSYVLDAKQALLEVKHLYTHKNAFLIMLDFEDAQIFEEMSLWRHEIRRLRQNALIIWLGLNVNAATTESLQQKVDTGEVAETLTAACPEKETEALFSRLVQHLLQQTLGPSKPKTAFVFKPTSKQAQHINHLQRLWSDPKHQEDQSRILAVIKDYTHPPAWSWRNHIDKVKTFLHAYEQRRGSIEDLLKNLRTIQMDPQGTLAATLNFIESKRNPATLSLRL